MQNQIKEKELKEAKPDVSPDAAAEKPCVLDEVKIEELAVDGICGIY